MSEDAPSGTVSVFAHFSQPQLVRYYCSRIFNVKDIIPERCVNLLSRVSIEHAECEEEFKVMLRV